MRRFAALAAALVIATIAGCGSGSNKDPYQLVYAASRAAMPDLVQVRIGATIEGGTPITVSPDAFKLTADSKTRRFRVQVELPIANLGIPAAQLQAFGVTGDSISADLLWDGTAVYLNSPVGAKALSLLMTQLGQAPPGNLAGWLKLGTAAEFAALAGKLGAMPSIAPAPSAPTITDGASLKAQLEPNGVTLTYVETVSRDSVTANHVTVAIDWAKLAANPALNSLSSAQLAQLMTLKGKADLGIDLWLDAASSRLVEIDAHVAQAAGTASGAPAGTPERAEIVILIGTPDAATTLDAPTTSTEVPLAPLVQALIDQFGTGLLPTP